VPAACSGGGMGCYQIKCDVGVHKESWGSMKSLYKEEK
jgi:hypothetical protein